MQTDPPPPPDQPMLALRVVTMPRETNPYGTIFGGVILSYIDQAGFVQALRHGQYTWVTASLERVDFCAPVHLGDIVNLYTRTTREGRTSLTVRVEVIAERAGSAERVHVTAATVTMVALGEDGAPTPFSEGSDPV